MYMYTHTHTHIVFFLRSLLFLSFIWTFFSRTPVIPFLLKTGFYSQKFLINKKVCPGDGLVLRVYGAQFAPEAADLMLGFLFKFSFWPCWVFLVWALRCGERTFSSRRA